MKTGTLSEGSESYYTKNIVYETFCDAEDKPGKILKILKKLIKNKIVLDVGCGTGKYAALLSSFAKKYICLDVSSEQLKFAKEKVKSGNVDFICSSAEKINLLDESIEVIISTWAVSTILEVERRNKVLSELLRVLKNGGSIFLVENDLVSEFEELRGKDPVTGPTKKYNDWAKEKGFESFQKIKTFFEFSSLKETKEVFMQIWGEKVASKIKNKKISHAVIIFSKIKEATS